MPGATPRKSSARTPGEILQPHPPPCDSDVNRGVGENVDRALIELRIEENGGR